MSGQIPDGDGDGKGLPLAEGMSLRDYFAAHVSLTPSELDFVMLVEGPEQQAREARIRFQKADALLKERNKQS